MTVLPPGPTFLGHFFTENDGILISIDSLLRLWLPNSFGQTEKISSLFTAIADILWQVYETGPHSPPRCSLAIYHTVSGVLAFRTISVRRALASRMGAVALGRGLVSAQLIDCHMTYNVHVLSFRTIAVRRATATWTVLCGLGQRLSHGYET